MVVLTSCKYLLTCHLNHVATEFSSSQKHFAYNMVPVKILPEAIFSDVHNKQTYQEVRGHNTFLLLSITILHLHVYGDLYIGSSGSGSSHLCDKAEIFYVSAEMI